MTNPQDLQGIYQFGTHIIYLAYQPVDEIYMYKPLTIGTSIGGYSSMVTFKTLPSLFFLHLTPLIIGWLPTSAIPSDLYPELFI